MRWSASRPIPRRLGEAIKIGRRGSLNGRLKVTGMQGHVAYPHLAKNPLKGLVAMLARLYEQPLDFGSAYFSPSNFEVTSIDVGNPTTNVIPVRAEAMFNIRYNDRHTAETLQTKVRELAAKFLEPNGLDYELTFEPPSQAFLTEPGQLELDPHPGRGRGRPGSRRRSPPTAARPTRASSRRSARWSSSASSPRPSTRSTSR